MIDIKKLTRSRDDKVLSGVLGGIGEYFDINPLFLRIIYVIFSIGSFLTMTIVYIIASLIIPLVGDSLEEDSDYTYRSNSSSFLGISLIALGIILLARNFLPIYFPELISMIRYYSRKLIDFWPIIFIVLGIYLLIDKKNKS